MNNLTIIMYHYVRPIINSRFPRIKGLELDSFKKQLDYLESHYSIISSNQVINAVVSGGSLPPKACWLTFDDGYKDHFKYVLPELIKRKLSGAFFVPRVAVQENKMLDVNSIHHILSCSNDINYLVKELNLQCILSGITNNQIQSYLNKFCVGNRFDDAKTVYFKLMLQRVLPEEVRHIIISNLFKKFVGISEAEFSNELYMSLNEVQQLVGNGMHVGSHGSMHYWLDRISIQRQKEDILTSLEFLEEIGMSRTNWIMCYPYGAYNNDTLSLVKKLGASVGVTTEVREADLSIDNPFILPRFDTNDFPK